MNPIRKVIVLCSGGLDSVTALYWAHRQKGFEVAAVLSFDYGSKHNAKEIPYAAFHAHKLNIPHVVIPLHFINEHFKSDLLKSGGAVPEGHYEEDNMKSTVVPFRNGILLAIAAGIAESHGARHVVIGAHAGDHAIYPDCRAQFMQAMNRAIQLGTYAGVTVIAPFQHLSKAEIVAEGSVTFGIDYATTWSCYKGEATELHCGKCGTCVERREAFYLAGLVDPTQYAPDAPTLEELIATNFGKKDKPAGDPNVTEGEPGEEITGGANAHGEPTQ